MSSSLEYAYMLYNKIHKVILPVSTKKKKQCKNTELSETVYMKLVTGIKQAVIWRQSTEEVLHTALNLPHLQNIDLIYLLAVLQHIKYTHLTINILANIESLWCLPAIITPLLCIIIQR